MKSLLGMCCVNRQKDSLDDSYAIQQVGTLQDYYLSQRPHLSRVLQLFTEIETHFR